MQAPEAQVEYSQRFVGVRPAVAGNQVYVVRAWEPVGSEIDLDVLWSAPDSNLGVTMAPEVTVSLSGSIAPGWVLSRPLGVTIEQDVDGSWVASDGVFAVYGDGATRREAIQDLVLSLLDYYEQVLARADSTPENRTMWQRLRQYLSPVTVQ